MWWEAAVVGAAIAGSLLLVGRNLRRSLSGKEGGCGCGTGKCPAAGGFRAVPPPDARRGE